MDDRIVRARIETLRRRATRARAAIGPWEARTAEHTGPAEYRFDGAWAPAALPGAWPAGRTLFIRAETVLPRTAEDTREYLAFDTRLLEGLLSVDGRPYAGVDAEHRRVPCPAPGKRLLEVEFTCVPAASWSEQARGEMGLLGGVQREVVLPDMEALAADARFAWEAARVVRDPRRRDLIDAALEKALLSLDLTAPDEELRSAATAARVMLRGLVASIGNDPEEGRIFLTGHSHIDTAWLWPLRETIRKCGRTFATACRLLEAHPGYRFTCSQPQLYAYVKRYYPSLYEEIRGWIAAGRWECTGGMWVEADCNIPSGESLIRQILHGVTFFRQEFGRRPRTCWLPDVFGYPGSLPGILAGCGLTGFYTNKIHWQSRNPLPSNLFRWEGTDGACVIAHVPRLPDFYNGFPNPAQLRAAWDGFSEKALHPEVLFPFGHGDGGGGPTEEMVESAERARGFPGLPTCRQGLEEEFFDEAAAAGPLLPVWTGELYLETHRGTYTTQSAIKKANRANESGLRDAEILTSIATIASDGTMAAREDGETWGRLRDAWQDLLLLQFHDILPGSSIREVYREALVTHQAIAATARDAKARALERLGAGAGTPAASVTLFNTLSWDRGDPVQVDVEDPDPANDLEVVAEDGSVLPAQRVDGSCSGGRARIAFVPSGIPSVGTRGFIVRRGSRTSNRISASGASGGGMRVESPLFDVEVDARGALTRLIDRRNDREVVPAGARANELQLFQDGPEAESAWNIHDVYEKQPYAWDETGGPRVVEQGPVRAVIRTVHVRRQSRIEQDMVVWADHGRIDFLTRARWQERQVLLKAAFPVSVRSDAFTCEIQFGAIRRPTHRNTSWDREKFEVCCHRWIDLSEPGYGVSLLNDSRYGCDARGSVLRLTLLRGAEWPDPDADRGEHEFVYSLFPHAGDWTGAGTIQRAAELNAPCLVSPSSGARRSFLSIDGPAILQTVKRAEDGDGWIIRFSEARGGRGRVEVRLPGRISSLVECNHVEENAAACPFTGDTFAFTALPFQVRSFRVRF
jgi:alpha-mannosidase